MKVIRTISLAVMGVCTIGCYGAAFHEPLARGYSLFAMDNDTDVAFVEDGDGAVFFVVSPRVFAVGWDSSFFIIKQHPDPQYGPKIDPSLNRTLMSLKETRFYILRIQDKKLFGPFGESDFASQRQTLGVPPKLTFTKILADLENPASLEQPVAVVPRR